MYNEYSTVANKVLLNVEQFYWGTLVSSYLDIKNEFISIDKEEAIYQTDLYREEVEKIIKRHEDDPVDELTENTPYAVEVDTDNNEVSSGSIEEEIEELKNSMKQSLLDKNYVLGKDVIVTVH